MLNCDERTKCNRGYGSAWNRKRRFPPGSSGQELPASWRPGSPGSVTLAEERRGWGSQQRDPKHKQSPKRGRNSHAGENTPVRFLSCLWTGEGKALQAGLNWQWPLVAGGAWAPHVLLGTFPARGGRGCPSVQLFISQDTCSRTQGCTSGAGAWIHGGSPTSASLPKVTQWPSQASCRATWKGNVEANIKIDDTHVQGSGNFSFSPAVLVRAQAGYRIHFTQDQENVVLVTYRGVVRTTGLYSAS